MGFIGKFFGKKTIDAVKISDTPFRAQIIFECGLVPENNKKVQAAMEEFIEKYPNNIAEPPRVNIASDGNVIEIVLLCKEKEELIMLNKELESIAQRYGLR